MATDFAPGRLDCGLDLQQTWLDSLRQSRARGWRI